MIVNNCHKNVNWKDQVMSVSKVLNAQAHTTQIYTSDPHYAFANSYLAAVADLPKHVGVQGGELFTNLIGQFFHSINIQ